MTQNRGHFRQWSDSSGDLPNILGKVGRAAMGFGAASNMLPPPEKYQPTNTLAKPVVLTSNR